MIWSDRHSAHDDMPAITEENRTCKAFGYIAKGLSVTTVLYILRLKHSL